MQYRGNIFKKRLRNPRDGSSSVTEDGPYSNKEYGQRTSAQSYWTSLELKKDILEHPVPAWVTLDASGSERLLVVISDAPKKNVQVDAYSISSRELLWSQRVPVVPSVGSGIFEKAFRLPRFFPSFIPPIVWMAYSFPKLAVRLHLADRRRHKALDAYYHSQNRLKDEFEDPEDDEAPSTLSITVTGQAKVAVVSLVKRRRPSLEVAVPSGDGVRILGNIDMISLGNDVIDNLSVGYRDDGGMRSYSDSQFVDYMNAVDSQIAPSGLWPGFMHGVVGLKHGGIVGVGGVGPWPLTMQGRIVVAAADGNVQLDLATRGKPFFEDGVPPQTKRLAARSWKSGSENIVRVCRRLVRLSRNADGTPTADALQRAMHHLVELGKDPFYLPSFNILVIEKPGPVDIDITYDAGRNSIVVSRSDQADQPIYIDPALADPNIRVDVLTTETSVRVRSTLPDGIRFSLNLAISHEVEAVIAGDFDRITERGDGTGRLRIGSSRSSCVLELGAGRSLESSFDSRQFLQANPMDPEELRQMIPGGKRGGGPSRVEVYGEFATVSFSLNRDITIAAKVERLFMNHPEGIALYWDKHSKERFWKDLSKRDVRMSERLPWTVALERQTPMPSRASVHRTRQRASLAVPSPPRLSSSAAVNLTPPRLGDKLSGNNHDNRVVQHPYLPGSLVLERTFHTEARPSSKDQRDLPENAAMQAVWSVVGTQDSRVQIPYIVSQRGGDTRGMIHPSQEQYFRSLVEFVPGFTVGQRRAAGQDISDKYFYKVIVDFAEAMASHRWPQIIQADRDGLGIIGVPHAPTVIGTPFSASLVMNASKHFSTRLVFLAQQQYSRHGTALQSHLLNAGLLPAPGTKCITGPYLFHPHLQRARGRSMKAANRTLIHGDLTEGNVMQVRDSERHLFPDAASRQAFHRLFATGDPDDPVRHVVLDWEYAKASTSAHELGRMAAICRKTDPASLAVLLDMAIEYAPSTWRLGEHNTKSEENNFRAQVAFCAELQKASSATFDAEEYAIKIAGEPEREVELAEEYAPDLTHSLNALLVPFGLQADPKLVRDQLLATAADIREVWLRYDARPETKVRAGIPEAFRGGLSGSRSGLEMH